MKVRESGSSDETMKAWLKAGLTVAIGVVIGLSAHATSLNGGCEKLEQSKFNGEWWLEASPQERENFLAGLGDCLIWSAHVKWIKPFDSESDRVTEYYKTHSEAVKLSVITAWRRVMAIAPERKFPKNAEVWTNPHSFYDGEHWRESGELESRGFLEGYLECQQRCVAEPKDHYSKPEQYYDDKITDYVHDHPRALDAPIADILRMFSDKD